MARRLAYQVEEELRLQWRGGPDWAVRSPGAINYRLFFVNPSEALAVCAEGDENFENLVNYGADANLKVWVRRWDWFPWIGHYEFKPVYRLSLEVDLERLPTSASVDAILKDALILEGIVIGCLSDGGAKRVDLVHKLRHGRVGYTSDRQEIILRVLYRTRTKSAFWEVHQDTITREQAVLATNIKRAKARIRAEAQRQLIDEILTVAVKDFDGAFPVKSLYKRFSSKVAFHWMVKLGQELEGEGVLSPGRGPHPRRVNLDAFHKRFTS